MTANPAGRPPSDPTLGRVFAMTGMPRSGTTYLSALLHRPPDVATISDPMGAWKDLWRAGWTCDGFLAKVRDFRRRLREGEPVPTLEGTGGFAGGGRVDTWNNRKQMGVVRVHDDALLGVKNPEIFLEILPDLRALGWPVVITVRSPVGTIQSWVRKGEERVRKGRPLAGHFANGDSATFCATGADPVRRRIELHEHWAARIREHAGAPGVFVVRYEDWFTRGAEQLEALRRFLGLPHPLALTPAPIAPDPVTLPPAEVDAIRAACGAGPVPPGGG